MDNDHVFAAESSVDSLPERKGQKPLDEAERAATVAAGGVSSRLSASERTPLLPGSGSPSEGGDEGTTPAWAGEADFAGLPWWKRPSVIWILPPFFVFMIAFGGIVVPRINLYQSLICDVYFADRAISNPSLATTPVVVGGDNVQCVIPEVQALVSRFTLYTNLLAGILSAITVPTIGAYSDRHGRLFVIALSSVGMLSLEIITIVVASRPDVFSVYWIMVGYALDGMCGSFIAGMAITHAYASDCTPPSLRSVAFGYFHCCLFLGIALGPLVAAWIVEKTGSLLSIYYVCIAAHALFILTLLFVVPESLTKERQLAARKKQQSLLEAASAAASEARFRGQTPTFISQLARVGDIFAPLKILWPTGPGSTSALRGNLFILAVINSILFGVAMAIFSPIVLYVELTFGWKNKETSGFVSIVNIARVVTLFLCLPIISWLFRSKTTTTKRRGNFGMTRFDITLIQIAILFDTLGYIGYATVKSQGLFVAAGIITAAGAMASPTVEAGLTKHVPVDRTGQILGAVGLLHALARILGPALLNLIYWKTVATLPQTIFIFVAAAFGGSLLLSLFLKPNVYYQEFAPGEGCGSPRDAGEQHGEDMI